MEELVAGRKTGELFDDEVCFESLNKVFLYVGSELGIYVRYNATTLASMPSKGIGPQVDSWPSICYLK